MSDFVELLRRETAPFVSLSHDQVQFLESHWNLLQAWNRRLNLSAIRTLDEAVRRHYVESLYLGVQLAPFVTAVDVGSGGGFPGLPVAILYPDRQITLVESHKRKGVFLRESARDLPNVSVRDMRFEELQGKWDVLISRAVTWSEIRSHAATVASSVALLVGPGDLDAITADTLFEWKNPIPLPDTRRGWVVLGDVSRGT